MSASEPRDNTISVFRCGDNFSGPLNREIGTTIQPWMPKKAVPDVYFTDDSILVITWLGVGYNQLSRLPTLLISIYFAIRLKTLIIFSDQANR